MCQLAQLLLPHPRCQWAQLFLPHCHISVSSAIPPQTHVSISSATPSPCPMCQWAQLFLHYYVSVSSIHFYYFQICPMINTNWGPLLLSEIIMRMLCDLCPTFSSLRYRTALASAVFYMTFITLAGLFSFPFPWSTLDLTILQPVLRPLCCGTLVRLEITSRDYLISEDQEYHLQGV